MKSSTRPQPLPSRFLAACLSISFVLPFAVILILMALNVRLGQGYFAYRYSPARELRTPRALVVLPIVAMACGTVWLLAQRPPARRRLGLGVLSVALLLAGVWSWWGPPSPLTQQMFNLTSPSSDGAFFLEAVPIKSLSRYLREFPRRLKEQTPQSLRGTRILSNPPGMTILTRLVLPDRPEQRGWLEEMLFQRAGVEREQVPLFADTLRLGVALCMLWAVSGVAAYLLGRVFLSPAGAATFALIATFNPSTMHFVPGKDPAQLLTINLMLWAWLAGWKRHSRPLCGLAGAILVLGATFGLIHIWVALAAWCATFWDRRNLLRETLFAAAGAVCVIAIAWIALGWNIPLTLFAVARRWTEIQKTFEMSRPIWYLIGLPIFLLFLSPGLWALAGLSLRRRRLNFGTRLALCTLAVMLLTYFVMGVTYELPRLWVAFLPPLTLGLAIDFPLLSGRGEHPRLARALMLIVLTQMLFTTFHWTLFDVRESEYRLLNKRYYT